MKIIKLLVEPKAGVRPWWCSVGMRRGTRGLPLRVEPNNLPRMADETIRVEYNQALKPLEELLEGVERTGDFFVNGVVEIPMPKLEVEGVGVLSFPVPLPSLAYRE